MMRGLASLILSALAVFGQQAPERRPGAAAPPRTVVVDAVVTDPEGRPVPGLSAADFALTQGGQPQKIDATECFDTARHTAATTASLPPIELTPDEIHRNFVLVIDDLGLSPEDSAALQARIGEFLRSLADGDRAAIIRTASGQGSEQVLTTDRRILEAAISRIQPVGRGMGETAIAAAIWQSLRWAVEGMRNLPGRKAVVLVSRHLQIPVAAGPALEYSRLGMATAAHAGMTVFYAVDPRGPTTVPKESALGLLAQQTGGMIAPDLTAVARDQAGFYVLAFQAPPDPTSLSGAARTSVPPVLSLERTDLTVRWRSGYVGRQQTPLTLLPADRTTRAQQAQLSALGGADLPVRVTALFAGYDRNGAIIEVMTKVDSRTLSVLTDTAGSHQISCDVQIAAYGDSGKGTSPPTRNFTLKLNEQEFERARGPSVLSTRLSLPGPGGYQVRAIVADTLSDRFGTAMYYLEVPPVNQGKFGLSGLVAQSQAAAAARTNAEAAELDPLGLPGVRQFSRGTGIAFTYGVFNPTRNQAKEAELETVTRIYATGRIMFDGRPVTLKIPATGNQTYAQVSGKVMLDPNLSPGEYVLEVEVTDKLATAAEPRKASQYMTFEVRE
jgi:VWFA-related protein